MGEVHYLAGAAVGSLIITQVYWVCGFIKMSMTGLSAQAKGQDKLASLKVSAQGLFIALLLALVILLLQSPVLSAGLFFAQPSAEVSTSISEYFSTRIWGAPAALCNLVIIGWLIGQQKTRLVLTLQLVINLVNIAASLLFVYGFAWGVKGVAAATVFAEYFMLLCAMFYIYKWTKQSFDEQSKADLFARFKSFFSLREIKPMLSLNSHIFVRNLALQFTLAFITLKGVQYGATSAAVNAIILQFFALIALGLDGIANGVEALVGEEKGKKRPREIHQQLKIGLLWSSCFALVYAVFFYLFDDKIVSLLTHHQTIKFALQDYTAVIVLLPIVAHWCFLLDGVYVGLSAGRTMRNSMLASTILGFLPIWLVFESQGNLSLWIAMLVFLACRGFLLGAHYFLNYHKDPNKLLRLS
jgi:MATE family multidrug resistance protein